MASAGLTRAVALPVVTALAFGFSPCPNDTFAFFAAVHGLVGDGAPRLQPFLADIEGLNRRALDPATALPVTKLSIPALARVTDRYTVLAAGAALGFGCGPLVVARTQSAARTLADLRGATVAIPGRHTTAFLLFALFAPADVRFVELRFDAIMAAVARGDCDAGLVIHESRFTYQDHGLRALADLGSLWEQDTGAPLPLGVIAARRDLGTACHDALATTLRASVLHARANPQASAAWVAEHAQELAPDVRDRHIALYVNDFSVDLGAAGRAAIDALLARGRRLGALPDGRGPWSDG